MVRLLMIGLVASCGFAPQDEFTGTRIGDGIGGWEDLGAVELCLANVRIGPAASVNGGLCVDRDTPNEAACTADDECASRERCVCGRCTVQFCSANGECGADRICSFSQHRCDRACSTVDDCVAGETCRSGVCTGTCGTAADCQTGEVCSSMGRCIVADCEDDAGCLATEICKVQREPRATAQPSVLAESGPDGPRYTMWLTMSNQVQTQRAIWRARSDDGVRYRFDPANAVLEDGGDAHSPSVVLAGGGFRVYYETVSGIRTADSPDGIDFGTQSTAIPGDFHAPAAAVTPTGDLLVYVQVGSRQGIALWDGSGAPTTIYRPADVTDPVLWRAVERVGSPSVLVETPDVGSPTVRLWFDAYGTESGSSVQFGEIVAIPPNDSIGYASTPLLAPDRFVTWAFNPVFDRVLAFLEHRAELAPAVVKVPGEEIYLLYFGGAAADGTDDEGIGVARNPPR